MQRSSRHVFPRLIKPIDTRVAYVATKPAVRLVPRLTIFLQAFIYNARSRCPLAALTHLQHFLPTGRHLISENGVGLRVCSKDLLALVFLLHLGHLVRRSEGEDTLTDSPARLRTESPGLVLNPPASRP